MYSIIYTIIWTMIKCPINPNKPRHSPLACDVYPASQPTVARTTEALCQEMSSSVKSWECRTYCGRQERRGQREGRWGWTVGRGPWRTVPGPGGCDPGASRGDGAPGSHLRHVTQLFIISNHLLLMSGYLGVYYYAVWF